MQGAPRTPGCIPPHDLVEETCREKRNCWHLMAEGSDTPSHRPVTQTCAQDAAVRGQSLCLEVLQNENPRKARQIHTVPTAGATPGAREAWTKHRTGGMPVPFISVSLNNASTTLSTLPGPSHDLPGAYATIRLCLLFVARCPPLPRCLVHGWHLVHT